MSKYSGALENLASGEMTLDQIENIFGQVFPGEEFDIENVKHYELSVAVEKAREDFMAAQRATRIKEAKRYLKAQGVNPKPLSEETLLAIWEGFSQVDETASSEEVAAAIFDKDEETGMYVSKDGEVLGYTDLNTQDISEVLEAVGERLTWLNGKLQGVLAEKQVWQTKIDEQFNPRINKFRRAIDWVEKCYTPMAERYIKGINDDIERLNKEAKASGKPVKGVLKRSLKLGLLTIKLNANRDSVHVEDEALAVQDIKELYAEERDEAEKQAVDTIRMCADQDAVDAAVQTLKDIGSGKWSPSYEWLNIKESVAKSAIPPEVKEALDLPNVWFIPGGTKDECSIK